MALFPRENGYVFIEKIWYFQALWHYSIVQKIQFILLEEFTTNLEETPIWGKIVKVAPCFQKNGFPFVDQIIHFWASEQY